MMIIINVVVESLILISFHVAFSINYTSQYLLFSSWFLLLTFVNQFYYFKHNILGLASDSPCNQIFMIHYCGLKRLLTLIFYFSVFIHSFLSSSLPLNSMGLIIVIFLIVLILSLNREVGTANLRQKQPQMLWRQRFLSTLP